MSTALGAIFRAETKLMLRNTSVAIAALLMPVIIAGLFLYTGGEGTTGAGWGFPLAMMLLMVFSMSTLTTAAASLSYRRDELYLKRLRCGESPDSVVLLGVLSPVLLVTLLQSVLMVGIIAVAGPALPANPLLLVFVIIAGTALGVGLGMATTGITSSSEQAQTAALPLVFVLIGSAVWAGVDLAEGLSQLQRALPGGAVVELMHLSYDDARSFTGALAEALPAMAALVAWVLVGWYAARRLFRWEPRH